MIKPSGIGFYRDRVCIFSRDYSCKVENLIEMSFSIPDPRVELAELGVGVHAVTGAFKSFLKLLPEPVIPNTHQTSLHEAMSEY